MKRKIIFWCAAIVMLAAMLAGCSQPAEQEAAQAPAAEAAADNAEKEADDSPAGNPRVEITMEDGGVILLELDPEQAPATVENFLKLANDGFYDGLTFHRIVPGFMIQGGDPDGNGTGGPGYTIVGEFAANDHDNNISHVRGVISMGRRGNDYDSAGSQFFITDADSTFLDGDYAAFGHVVEGMDVVDAIAAVPLDGETPVDNVVIQSIRQV